MVITKSKTDSNKNNENVVKYIKPPTGETAFNDVIETFLYWAKKEYDINCIFKL